MLWRCSTLILAPFVDAFAIQVLWLSQQRTLDQRRRRQRWLLRRHCLCALGILQFRLVTLPNFSRGIEGLCLYLHRALVTVGKMVLRLLFSRRILVVLCELKEELSWWQQASGSSSSSSNLRQFTACWLQHLMN
jgi:hypothetical protein